MYFDIFIVCLNTIASMINTNVFPDFHQQPQFDCLPSPDGTQHPPPTTARTTATRTTRTTRTTTRATGATEGTRRTPLENDFSGSSGHGSSVVSTAQSDGGECFVFLFFVCFALFIDLLTDKVQPLSR